MIINPNILKKIKQIYFTAQEPPSTNVLWAKPENGLFAFYLFLNDKWESVESSSSVEIPSVSVYLSAFINDVGYITKEDIKEEAATTEDIKSLFK